ncbi:MAG: AMP-binding protein [Alphaproteobacteria bacterium]|nr:AMP-binding protein [Alphaproteobacteria bacterium]
MSDFYDDLERRDPETRERDLMAALPDQIALAQTATSGFATILDGVPAPDIASRDALGRLPVTRKSDLIDLQKNTAPFGGLNATPTRGLRRLFMSPGPIADPQGRGPDWFRFGRALYAGGIRADDIVHNCFSYHFTPAGFMMEDAAAAIGCAVFPGGVGNTDAQVEAIAHFGATAYAGTPDFLKTILDRAESLGIDISSITKATVGGGALFPALREEYQSRGIHVRQSYGSADCGLIGYESEAMEGLILDERIIVEIVRPGTNETVPNGEIGEVVVTLMNPDYPLIRFGTGDLSAMLAGPSPCGRTAPRIKGWLGRADQATKVRGMFIHPGQIDAVIKRLVQDGAGIAKARLNVGNEDNRDTATLVCECADGNDALAARVAAIFSDICKIRVDVEFITPGGLANDGKIIDDTRSYD